MDNRLEALINWVAAVLSKSSDEIVQKISLLAGDASFRRYYRLTLESKTYVVMDAPPEKEPCEPFVAIAKCLEDMGLHVPEIFALDLEQGFLLISDLGDDLYFSSLNSGNADQLYRKALDDLVILQGCKQVKNLTLPSYDCAMYTVELERVVFWFFEQYLSLQLSTEQRAMLNGTFHLLIQEALSQPQVFTHRDYHSRNLLVLADQEVGIIDFQDSVWGAVTYDAVSLLRDCYIDWPKENVIEWALYFKQKTWAAYNFLPVSDEQYLRWFDWMGVQRHLKATYIFARKFCRDGQAEYLTDIPRTLKYIIDVTKDYFELQDLRNFMIEVVQPRLEQIY